MSKALNLYEAIYNARQRGASDDQIMAEIRKQNPDKEASFSEAFNRGAAPSKVLEEITNQNKPRFLERVKLSFGGESAQKKRIAIDAIESQASAGDIADVVGDIPALAGTVGGGLLGAALGAPTGPGAAATSVAGAAAGAAAGETVRQQIGNLLGVRTEEEGLTDVTEIGKQATLGAAAEIGGQAFGKFVVKPVAEKALAPIFDKIAGLDKTGSRILFEVASEKPVSKKTIGKTVEQLEFSLRTLNNNPLVKEADRKIVSDTLDVMKNLSNAYSTNVFRETVGSITGDVASLLKLAKGTADEPVGSVIKRMVPYALDYAFPGFGVQALAIKTAQQLSNPAIAVKVIYNLARISSYTKPLFKNVPMNEKIKRAIARVILKDIIDQTNLTEE